MSEPAANSYPMTVSKGTYDHVGGAKSYQLILVTTSAKKAIIIRRWGKTGRLNNMKVETYPTIEAASHALLKMKDERRSKGYKIQPGGAPKICADQTDLSRAIGITIFSSIGTQNLLHLDPNANVAGLREPDMTIDENGTPLGHQARIDKNFAESIKQAELDEKARKRAEEEAIYGNNPLYGAF